MSGLSARRSVLIALWAGALLAGCSGSSSEQDPPATTTTQKNTPKTADPGENMVAAVSAGKTATAVGVHFSLGNSPTVDAALPVEIAIIPHESFTSLGAHFESQDGLTMMSGDALKPIQTVGAEKAIKHQLRLMPVRAGVFIVTASVETEGVEGTVTRIFSIPVIVEAAAAASPEAPPAAPAPPATEPAPAAN